MTPAVPLYARSAAGERWATIRHIVEVVAIVAAGVWGFYVFIYQERIKPAGEPASLTTSITVRRLGRDATRDLLSVSSEFHNTGKTEIDVAADGFDVWGIRYGQRVVIHTLETSSSSGSARVIPVVSRTLVYGFLELRSAASGGNPYDHIFIEPDTTETIETTIVIPRNRYDALQAQIIAVPIKTSEHRKLHLRPQHNRDGSVWLDLHADDGIKEDDNRTEFSLLPAV